MKKFKTFTLLIITIIMTTLLIGCESQDKAILGKFFTSLNIPSELSDDFPLKSSYVFKNKTITVEWESSNTKYFQNDGTVNRTTQDEIVVLIGKAKLNDTVVTKAFNINIKGDVIPLILEEAAKIYMPTVINADKNLPTSKTVKGHEVEIAWSSSNEEIFSNTGMIGEVQVDTEITLKATFSCENHTLEKEFNITVLRLEKYKPINYYQNAPVYLGTIEGEKKPYPVSEYPGAIFRKVVSSRDSWLGIEAIVTLPEFTGDLKMEYPAGSGIIKYSDSPSVYIGANSKKESDVGLAWEYGATADNPGVLNYDDKICFRPFYRYITESGENIYNGVNWKDFEHYYYPGDKIRMSVVISSENKMQLKVELLEETTIPVYAQRRLSYNLGENYSKVWVSEEYESPGAGVYPSIFKRVCALDQYGNEGKPTRPTNAISKNIIWHEVYLYRNIDGKIYKVPMTEERSEGICSPVGQNSLGDFTNAIKLTYDNVDKALGGECVTISPNNRKD